MIPTSRLFSAAAAVALLTTRPVVSLGQSPAPAFAPLVDYHQHLASPAGVALINRTLPPVTVPPAIASLLTFMAEHWNDSTALSTLYAQDAVMLANYDDALRGFIRGPAAAGSYASRLFGRAYRVTPVTYTAAGGMARLAGYFTRGEGASARNFAYFYFDLAAQPDGSWRIAGDSRTFDPAPIYQDTISGKQLVQMLDSAGIRQAVVLSDAYWFDSPDYMLPGESAADVYAQVRAENDWTANEAARSNGRLVAFCSFNPLAAHAIAELKRCKSSGKFAGLKLHLQTAGVDLLNPEHVAKVREVFAEANTLRFPITVHAQTAKHYGRESAQIFIDRVLSAAPDIPVTIAHLWGGGPFAPEPLAVYVSAVTSRNPVTRNLYFDLAEAALVANARPAIVQAIASAIRQIGPERMLFGSDAVGPSTLPPIRAAAQLRKDIPLTEKEFAIIAGNLLPYLH